MTESLNVNVKSRSSGKIYLSGTACGDSGKKYCLNCYVYSNKLFGYVGNKYHSYTYFSGGKCIDIGSQGCYIPDYGDGEYRIFLDEVTEYGCDYIIRGADAITIDVTSEPDTVLVNILVKDQHDTKIAGADVTIPTAQGATTITTNYQGVAAGFTLEKSVFHTADITYIPSDWEKTSDSTRTFVPTDGSTYVLYVNKKVTECTLDFYVCDQEAYPVNGATCYVGGKTSTTNTSGMCSITLACGNSYTATCNAPSGYTCDCGGCKCSYGPFTPTSDGFITFTLDKVVAPIEYCQQNFKVLDQNGEPVEYAIVGCEDLIDYTNFNVLGHSGTGTSADGTVSTLKTIKGRPYNFYISQLPAGYDFDADGVSSIHDVVACTSEALFRIKKTVTYCEIDFYVYDKEAYPVNGATCIIGGKTSTTNASGMCSITVTCGNSYTATCNAPSGYTCDCGGCKCSYGPFTPTSDGFITFTLDKVVAPIEYCQQNFKVLDQNGEPVEYAIVGCEDLIDYTNFNVLGHSGTGTSADGTVSTLKTIKGRSYNFYISQLPAGYDFDIDGVSSIHDVVACTSEALFKIKNLSTTPWLCSINVCVQDQDGKNIPGVAISITGRGTVYTKDTISMFGCTGKLGLTCGNSITTTATVPNGYEGVKTTETFTLSGDMTIILTIKKSDIVVICAGKTKAECDASTDCYWWNSDNACHDTKESVDNPILKITSDMDVLSGISVYVDGALRGITPVTIPFSEDDIGRTVSVTGSFAEVIETKVKRVELVEGSNEVALEILMDNKEILAGGAITSVLIAKFV